jgi:hypothetical protein
MPSILDEGYGLEEARRERTNKRIVIAVLIAAFIGGFAYFHLERMFGIDFRTFKQKNTLNQFLATLNRKDFQGAYRMFGCTPEQPCKYYDADQFNRDWGPDSPYSHTSAAKIDNVEYCNDVVLFNVSFPNAEPLALTVDRTTNVVGFAAWERCPGRHWEFKRFFQSLFS